MKESLTSYVELCAIFNRDPAADEYMVWAYLGIAPKWYEEAIDE